MEGKKSGGNEDDKVDKIELTLADCKWGSEKNLFGEPDKLQFELIGDNGSEDTLNGEDGKLNRGEDIVGDVGGIWGVINVESKGEEEFSEKEDKCGKLNTNDCDNGVSGGEEGRLVDILFKLVFRFWFCEWIRRGWERSRAASVK